MSVTTAEYYNVRGSRNTAVVLRDDTTYRTASSFVRTARPGDLSDTMAGSAPVQSFILIIDPDPY